MARSSWDGFLRLSLISIPVRAFNSAIANHGAIAFNQIHKGCGEREQYKKTCPVHGELTKEEVVTGFPIKKGEYVEVPHDEIADLRAEDDEAIDIDAFLPPDAVAPVYFSGKTFYLLPEGAAGQKPYGLLVRVMTEKGVHAIAHMVLSGHEQQVLIRPVGKLLEMAVLYYASQVKPADEFESELAEVKVSAQETKLASALVSESVVDSFDLTQLTDRYAERVRNLIKSKSAGTPMKKPHKTKPRPVINLMEALKKSLNQTKGKKATPRGSKRTG